jgi:hypothetical protein
MRVIPSFVSTWKQISCYFLIFTLKLKELLSIKQTNWRMNTISGILITWDNRSNNHWTKRTVMNRACLLNTQTLRIRKNDMLYMKLLQWIPFLAIKLQIYRQFTAGSRWHYCLIFTQTLLLKLLFYIFTPQKLSWKTTAVGQSKTLLLLLTNFIPVFQNTIANKFFILNTHSQQSLT